MDRDEFLEDIQIRILRVTEDLRAIQQQLNNAAMEGSSDPQFGQTDADLPELEALQVLKSALDQMRHFLWFYLEVMSNDSEEGERLRQSIRKKVTEDATFGQEAAFLEALRHR